MSKIIKNKKDKDMHSHNEKAYEFLDKNLPTAYVEFVVEKMRSKGSLIPSKSMIRNVRNKTNFRNDILLALVEVAEENKANADRIKLLTT